MFNKLNCKGLQSIVQLAKSVEKFNGLFETNFLLKHNAGKYPLLGEFKQLVSVIKRLLELEISQVTPANVLEALEQAECIKDKIQELLSVQGEHDFTSAHAASVELYAIIDTIVYYLQDLVNQSRSNTLQSLQNYHKSQKSEDLDIIICQLRDSASILANAETPTLLAQSSTLIFNILKHATKVDPELNKSLSYLNKGL